MITTIHRPRAGGKTHDSLQWMTKNPTSVMVCVHRHAADAAHRQAEILGLDIDRSRFITAEEASRAPKGPKPRAVFDNLDLWLPLAFPSVDLEMATFNGNHAVTVNG